LRIGLDQWRLRRAYPLEAGIYRDRFFQVAVNDKVRETIYNIEKAGAEKRGEPVPPPPTPPDPGDLLARAFNVDSQGANSFTKLARYESSLQRSIDRYLRQLKIYQAARNASEPDVPEVTDAPSAAENAPDPPPTPSKTSSKNKDCEANPKNGGIAPETAQVAHASACCGGLQPDVSAPH